MWASGVNTLTVGADQGGEVSDESNSWEVCDVSNLQSSEQRLEPFRTEPAETDGGGQKRMEWKLRLRRCRSRADLRGLRSMQTFSKMSLRNWGVLSWTTCWTLRRDFRYSRNRFRKPTKCSAVLMVPGTASGRRGKKTKINILKWRNVFGVSVNLQLRAYLGEFHLVIPDLKGKHLFLWQY